MRPILLEIDGFTAFRKPTTVDFSDCDFFVLSGPTGAGKSSVIDAITFALYGAIPRLDKSQIAPVIAQGLLEASVRLDFSVGPDRYTAARVVTRTKTGATTREARLEKDGVTLAGDAKSVTEEVERILGLTYEHFTRCVVLPQGEFAEFLHAKQAERQDLLVKLLDVDVYARMGTRARKIGEEAKEKSGWLAKRIEQELSFATPESRAEAATRLTQLEAFATTVADAAPKVEALKHASEAARGEAESSRSAVALLAGIKPPAGAAASAAESAKARTTKTAAAAALAAASAALSAAEQARSALPDAAELAVALQAHQHLARALKDAEEASTVTLDLVAREASARKNLEQAEERCRSATDALDAAKLAHAAHDVARSLAAGEPCPVCLQTVTLVPEAPLPPELAGADAALDEATRGRDRMQTLYRTVERDRAAAEARVQELGRIADDLRTRAGVHTDVDAIQAALRAIEEAGTAVRKASATERAARTSLDDAQRALDQAEEGERTARKLFQATRDRAGALGPPPVDGADLTADWEGLLAWAKERSAQEHALLARAQEKAAGADTERTSIIDGLLRTCASLQITREAKTPLSEAVMTALVEQRAKLDRIDAALEESRLVAEQRTQLNEEQAVASKLGQHLSASMFEKWLVEEAMRELVLGATENLRDLSAGAYSLTLDPKSGAFWVVDHRNADERRPAKTLSGGETFLASLSLALALSDRLAQMAAEGARLDSIFLDEGFGTLDAETLETVASAIESLAAGGRMVGLVTHVPQVAERVPVRFEVRKRLDSAAVEKVYT